jgi:hypothetical protein
MASDRNGSNEQGLEAGAMKICAHLSLGGYLH